MKTTPLFALLIACGSTKPAQTVPAPVVTEPEAPPPAAPAAQPAPPPRPEGHPDPSLIPRSVLFGNPERANVQLSHDGAWISWLAAKDGVLNVWVAPTGKLDQARAITSDTSHTRRPVRSYFWPYTNTSIVFEQDTGGDENFHLFRADLADGKTVDLTPYKARAQLIGLSEKKPGTIIVGINDRDPKAFDIYAIDVKTGKRTLVYQNDDGVTDFGVDHALALRTAAKPLPDGSTQMLVRKGTTWEPFETIPYEDSFSTGTAGFDGTGKLLVQDSRGRNTGALVAIDLATRKHTTLVEDDQADVGDAIQHPSKHTVQAVRITYDRTRIVVLDKAFQPDVDALDKLAEGGDWTLPSRTLDDKKWLVLVQADVAGPRYYLYDHARHAATFLFAAQPALDNQPLAHMHPVTITSRDGLPLISYLTLPTAVDKNGAVEKPVPMVLFVHGGPWSRDEWHFNPVAQILANRGYAVLQVNYRGSTGFGKAFVNAGDRQWGGKMHDDLVDAVDWAVKQGIAPRDRICILGGSYGGYATLVGVTMTPDVFRCGVDIVGPSNLLTFIAAVPAYWAPYLSLIKKRIGDYDSAEGKAALTAASPLTHVDAIKVPLLIGQGANDPRVNVKESEQIVAAMNAHHLPVTYAVFPDEGHGFARPENNVAFFALTEAFLSAYLGGSYLPITKAELDASSMKIEDGKDGVPGLP